MSETSATAGADSSASAPPAIVSRRFTPITRFDIAALISVYLIWGSTYLAIKWTLESFPPLMGTGLRFLTAGTILLLWCRWRGMPWPDKLSWRNAAIIGPIVLGGGTGSVAVAEQWVSSAHVAVLIGCSPLLGCIWTGFFGRWPTKLEWAGVVIGAAGAILLASRGEMRSQPLGVLLAACAMTCWTLGSVLSQHKFKLVEGPMGFAIEMLCGGAALVLFGALMGEQFHGLPTLKAFGAWVYLVTFGSLIGFTAFKHLLGRHSPAIAFSYAYVNPLVAVLLGVMLGRETFSMQDLVATAIIVGAVALSVSARRG